MDRLCIKCHLPTFDLYMVHDEVWPFSKDEVAHIKCLEDHLGRPLIMADFNEKPINNMIRFGYNMGRKGF